MTAGPGDGTPKAPSPPFVDLLRCPQLHTMTSNPIWTVSDVNKRPLDVRTIFTDHPAGARPNDEGAVTSIRSLYRTLGPSGMTNLATYWNYDLSSYMLLDVESHADPALLARMTTLPAVYAEYSLSGKGMHLVMPMPDLPDGQVFPEVRYATVLHGDGDDWEIHLRHWVTFTGLSVGLEPTDEGRALWTSMFVEAATRFARSHDGTSGPMTDHSDQGLAAMDADPPELMDEAIESFGRVANRPRKTKADFRYDRPHRGKGPYDLSRFEMSCMCHYAGRLLRDMEAGRFYTADGRAVDVAHDQWTPTQVAYILYRAADAGLAGFEHRAKHDTKRLGVPYLYHEALCAVDLVGGGRKGRGPSAADR